MRQRMRSMAFVLLVFGFIISGCNGNGGGTSMMPDPDPDPPVVIPTPPTCMEDPDDRNCTGDPPKPMNTSFLGTDTEALAAILLPDKQGMGAGINDAKRPGQGKDEAPMFTAGGDLGKTTVDGDILNKDDDAIKDAEEFSAVTDAPRAVLDGFSSSVHTRTMETDAGDMATDTLTLYSDVKSRSNEKYLKYFADDSDHRPDVVDSIGKSGEDTGVLTFGGTIATDEAGLFMADAFPSGDSQTYTYADDDKSTPDKNEETRGGRKLEGTFAGIEGEYSCTGPACSATTRKDGTLSKFSGTWTFIPDGTNVLVRDVIPDADYLSFGYWVQETEKEDGKTTYGVSTFYGGSQPFTGAISALRGTATYEGKATGLYVKKTYDVGVNDFAPSSSGQFTADASLIASFGGDDVAVSKQYRVEGTVGNFMDDGEMIDQNWMVKLEKSLHISKSGAFMGETSTGNGSTSGGWEGQFYGNHVETDPETPSFEQYPNSVAGEFNAHFSPGGGQSPGHVIGSFGVTQ